MQEILEKAKALELAKEVEKVKEDMTNHTTRVTGKGQAYIIDRLLKEEV